jgi:hypothetical protein
MMRDFKTMIKNAKLPERTISVCLRGDLVADHEEAERALEQAQQRPADSLAGNGTSTLADRILALEEEMREQTYPFRLRALPRHEFRALMTEHPPRTDGEGAREDGPFGVNRDTFFPALIRRSTIDPELDEQSWAELLDEQLTDFQFQELALGAWVLNAREVDVPFSRAASRVRQGTAGE